MRFVIFLINEYWILNIGLEVVVVVVVVVVAAAAAAAAEEEEDNRIRTENTEEK